ncbi:Carbohydrate-binding protein, partial [Globisporangium splendens]
MKLFSLAALACASMGAAADTYDVIVVGSGPGGLVAAETLSRTQFNLSVLVLEAGNVSLQASGGTDTLAYAQALGFTKFDIPGEFDNTIYNDENEKYRVDWITTPYMWLGKLVGGCSSINAALYFRTPDSYVTKAVWPFSAADVTAGFDAIEKFFGHTETPSSDGKHYVQEAYKIVGDALTGVGYSAQTLNSESARNNKNATFGHPPYAIAKGLRDAPAKTFYSEMKARGNFKLVTNARVQYIVQTQGVATGVVYQDSTKTSVTVGLSSRGVVVLAAGALSTPQVLMQSGIGPSKELAALAALGTTTSFSAGVQTKASWVENANVGQSVFDANVVYASLSHPDMTPFLNKKRPADAIAQYVKDQSGSWATPGPVLIAYETMTVGDREYDLQTTVLPHGFADSYETENAYSMSLFVNNPESRDSISVSSSGSSSSPFNVATKGSWYLSTASDLQALQQYAHKMISAAVAAGSSFLDAKNTSASSIAAWVKANAGSVTHHFGGSCYTSSDASDTKRCADEKFKVIGTSNIYVSDASLMKEGTVNPYGFIMYIGHQAAKNILQEAFATVVTNDSTTAGTSGTSGNATMPSSSNGGFSESQACMDTAACVGLLRDTPCLRFSQSHLRSSNHEFERICLSSSHTHISHHTFPHSQQDKVGSPSGPDTERRRSLTPQSLDESSSASQWLCHKESCSSLEVQAHSRQDMVVFLTVEDTYNRYLSTRRRFHEYESQARFTCHNALDPSSVGTVSLRTWAPRGPFSSACSTLLAPCIQRMETIRSLDNAQARRERLDSVLDTPSPTYWLDLDGTGARLLAIHTPRVLPGRDNTAHVHLWWCLIRWLRWRTRLLFLAQVDIRVDSVGHDDQHRC